MRPTEKMEKLVDALNDTTTPDMDRKVITDIVRAMENRKETTSAKPEPNVWRIIMKSRITKLAAAASIIAVLVPVIISVRRSNVPGNEATVKGPKSIVANSGWNFPPLGARIAQAPLIVRGIIKTIGRTTNLQPGMDHARIQFQVKKVIVGELTSAIITVDVSVSPGDSAETSYPVEQEVIWFLQPLKTDREVIYFLTGGPDPGGLEEQEKAIQEALSHPVPSQGPSHW